MSSVETRKFEPATGTALNLGASGDAVTLPAGVTLQTNTIKDAGGNTIFTSDGAGTLSSVNSALQGNMALISSQTASGSSGVAFTSGIDGTYDEYMFVFVNIDIASSESSHKFQFNGSTDGGSNYNTTKTTTVFESIHTEGGSTYFQYNTGYDLAQSTSYQTLTPNQEDDDADASSSGILHLFAPSSTTFVKQFYCRSHTMNDESGGAAATWFTAGYLNTTSAVNAINFQGGSSTFSGSIYLYGIK